MPPKRIPPSGARPSKPKPATLAQTGALCMNGCGKPASSTFQCPKCRDLGVKDAYFCGEDCFIENYREHHKRMHVPGVSVNEDVFTLPEGTKDPFSDPADLAKIRGYKDFKYTGPLRAVYPLEEVPRREVPKDMPVPDYVNEVNGVSFDEELSQRERKGKCLSAEEIEGMRKVCKLGREVLDIAAAALKPGVTTLEIDQIVHEECMKRNAYPSPLGYGKFPRSVCTSINEVICHGIPDARPLQDGDIINLDVSLYHGGFHSDLNATYPVGPSVSQKNLDLISCSRECLDEAIRACRPGFEFRQIGEIIEYVASKRGFSTNKTFVGHGVNQLFHPAHPSIPHYAGNRAGGRMEPGQTFTIEPMICTARQEDVHWPDNWTAATADGKPSAQFEETLLITETGVEVLTAAPGWVLPEKRPDLAEVPNWKIAEMRAMAAKRGKPRRR
ncbi:hypothetical protein JCM10213_002422 [Rhodosporidiobolus nylandii]